MKLVRPTEQHLPGYVAALERGWSADNVRGAVAAREELAKIANNPSAFVASLVETRSKGRPGDTARRIDGGAHSRLSPLRQTAGFSWACPLADQYVL